MLSDHPPKVPNLPPYATPCYGGRGPMYGMLWLKRGLSGRKRRIGDDHPPQIFLRWAAPPKKFFFVQMVQYSENKVPHKKNWIGQLRVFKLLISHSTLYYLSQEELDSPTQKFLRWQL